MNLNKSQLLSKTTKSYTIHFQIICIHSYALHCFMKGILCVFISVRLFPFILQKPAGDLPTEALTLGSNFIHESGFIAREDSKSIYIVSSMGFGTTVYSCCFHVRKWVSVSWIFQDHTQQPFYPSRVIDRPCAVSQSMTEIRTALECVYNGRNCTQYCQSFLTRSSNVPPFLFPIYRRCHWGTIR